MGKNSNKGALGRTIIKDRFARKGRQLNNESFLHTAELDDGYDWSKLNLRSVTEENSLNEFLSTAELAGTDFTAEKLNVTFVNPKSGVGLLTNDEKKRNLKSHEQFKELLRIPRRPKWDAKTTAEQLKEREREAFLTWRRNLAEFEQETELLLTPYEKNLDFWRQLWRVVERSDVLVQIVDARNPLLFRCEDLERYVKEVDKNKLNLILCNKADFLVYEQRCAWARYFESIGVAVVFFSALQTANDENKLEEEKNNDSEQVDEEIGTELSDCKDDDFETDEEEELVGEQIEEEITYHHLKNSPKLMNRDELINFFRTYPRQNAAQVDKKVTIGLVGYPNVGKSSTINTLLTYKKVSVSATPGKTKHFQTVILDKDITLCDCPGLVMPSFVLTKADMILNGILPIDQMREHVPPVNLVCSLIPRRILETKYSIMIPKPEEGENPNRPPFAEELLNAYAYNRGFMTANGEPDNPRAARYILKDFLNGKLLYCYAPPTIQQEEFHIFEDLPETSENRLPKRTLKIIKPFRVATRDLEYNLFKEQSISNAHVKGAIKCDPNSMLRLQMSGSKTDAESSKPWKNHKEKRNKHEKLRVKYKCLDD